jgi:HK97 gp10 family phage protein
VAVQGNEHLGRLMAKPKYRLESKIPQVKDSMHDAVRVAVELALNTGEGDAEKRLERIDDTRGYELPIDIGQDKSDAGMTGKIFYEPWYGRFFEFGTPTIPAASFMRPANRKMRKQFLGTMGPTFEGFVKRRARVR